LLHTGNQFRGKRQILPQSKRLENYFFQGNSPKKQAGVAILILSKIDFQHIVMKKDKEGYFILIKVKTNHDEISILNMYAPNVRASKFIKGTLVSSNHTLHLTQY
jgi:exonuclease III